MTKALLIGGPADGQVIVHPTIDLGGVRGELRVPIERKQVFLSAPIEDKAPDGLEVAIYRSQRWPTPQDRIETKIHPIDQSLATSALKRGPAPVTEFTLYVFEQMEYNPRG